MRRTRLYATALAACAGCSFASRADADDNALGHYPLLQYGVAIGAGVGLHGAALSHDPGMRGIATTGIAYAGFIPSYWFVGKITRHYCASATESQDQADAYAERLAKSSDSGDRLAASHWTRGLHGECIKTLTWLGAFVGLPADFDVNVWSNSDGVTKSREVRPLGAFGLMILPKAYVHLLAGVVISQTATGANDSDQRISSLFFGVGTVIDSIIDVFKP